MRINTLKFYIKEGAVSLFKNRLMTLASMGTIASCILLFILSYCAIANTNYVLKQIQSTIGISVYPVEDITDKRLSILETNLKAINNVSEVKYISPEEALESLKKDFGENSAVLDGLEYDNPLSKAFEVKVKNSESSKQVIADIRTLSDVEEIKEAEELVALLTNTSKALSVIGVIIVLILSAISIIIVMNTIKLTVYVRRKEINIMKYVGATDWFIRWPFIIEGVFIGLIGSVVPIAITALAYENIMYRVSQVPLISGIFQLLETMSIFPMLAPVCLVGGVLLGTCGSIYSIRKHLNV